MVILYLYLRVPTLEPIILFFLKQLDRITRKPKAHATGPTKPSLVQTETGSKPNGR